MKLARSWVWGWVTSLFLSWNAFAAEEFFLREGETVVFLGDSNTFADHYIRYLDAYLFTRFPDKQFHLLNRGMPSETVAGTSETTHLPPRPDLHTRLGGVLAATDPDVIIACYGMNDGIYQSPNPELMAKYQAGVKKLVQRVQDEAKARLVLLTPPPFDPTPFEHKPVSNPPDYRRPASDYDQALDQFSKWLLTLASQDIRVIDLHSPMSGHIKARRETLPRYVMAGDGIHFNATGHMLVALEILEHWKAPGRISEAKFDWTEIQAATSNPRMIKKEDDVLIFEWSLPLPMPIDPEWDPKAVSLERLPDRINEIKLQLVDLPEGNYRLTVDRGVLARFTKAELEQGVNIASLALFPASARSQEVLRLVQQRRQELLEFWVKNEPHPRLAGMHKQSTATLERAAELEKQIRELCKPKQYRFELLKVD